MPNEEIHYVFGHEAIALSKKRYLDEDIPIFYDIKRWISAPERMEKVTTLDGQYRLIRRKEILKAYFDYIIHLSQ